MNLAWSLKPIYIYLTICTGIDLDRSKKRSNLKRWLIIFYGLFWLIGFDALCKTFNIVRHNRALVDLISTNGNGNSTLVKELNFNLSWIAIAILSLMLHMSMFASALVRWKPLWKKLKLVQSIIGDQTSLYRQLRRDTIAGLSLLLAVRLIHCSANSLLSMLYPGKRIRLLHHSIENNDDY